MRSAVCIVAQGAKSVMIGEEEPAQESRRWP
jgi:hypothetical protein